MWREGLDVRLVSWTGCVVSRFVAGDVDQQEDPDQSDVCGLKWFAKGIKKACFRTEKLV